MMPTLPAQTVSQQIDLNSTTIPESQFIVPCAGFSVGSVQAVLTGGTWGTAVVTIRKSNDGANWTDYGATLTTVTTPEMTDLSVARFAFLGFFVTTAEGSAATGQLTVTLKSIEAIPA